MTRSQFTPFYPVWRNTMHRKMSRLVAASAALALTAGSAVAAPVVIYQDDFSGAAVALNGATPDVGANNWVAGAPFLADGTVNDPAGTAVGASATLAFTPVDGLIYTLDASFRNFANGTSVGNPENDWIALGFARGQSASSGNNFRFTTVATPSVTGVAWTLVRGVASTPGTAANVAQLGSTTTGAFSGLSWADPTLTLANTFGADIDVRVVLNTIGGAGAWEATWYAKLPADASYTEVRSETLLLTENINSVGIARSNPGFTVDVTSFSLTSVPEPGSLALLGLGGLMIARRRRD